MKLYTLLPIIILSTIIFLVPGISAFAQWKKCSPIYSGYYFCLYGYENGVLLAGSGGNSAFRSTDRGKTWNNVQIDKDIIAITQSGTSLYIATNNGIYRSLDSGATWSKPQQEGLPKDKRISTIAAINDQLFVGTLIGTYRSNDAGMTWSAVTIAETDVLCFRIWQGALYAGTAGQGIFCSTDNGTSWKQSGLDGFTIASLTNNSMYLVAGTNDGVFSSVDGTLWQAQGLSGGYIAVLEQRQSTIIAGTDNGIYQTNDMGKTWDRLGLEGYSITSVYADASQLYAATQNGIFMFTNGTWKLIGAHSNGNFVNVLQTIDGRLFAGTTLGLYRSDDEGESWSLAGFDGKNITTIELLSQSLYIGTSKGVSYRSDDRGNTWTSLQILPLAGNITSFASYDNWIFAGTNVGLFRSSTFGKSWEQVNSTPPIQGVGALFYDTPWLYTGGNGIVRSSDNGTTWQTIQNVTADIRTFLKTHNRIMAGTFISRLFYTDDGITWQQKLNTPSFTFRKLLSTDQVIIAITTDGIYFTDHTLSTWSPAQSQIFASGACLQSDSVLYVGSYADYIYSGKLKEINPIKVGVTATDDIHNLSIYISPHPMTTTGTIHIIGEILPSTKVKIHTIHGETVHSYQETDIATGVLAVPALSPGYYRITVQSQNTIITSPCIIH